jgi:hypothetical protein
LWYLEDFKFPVNSVEKISSEAISKEYISKMLNIAVKLVANDLSGGQV